MTTYSNYHRHHIMLLTESVKITSLDMFVKTKTKLSYYINTLIGIYL